MDDNQGTPNTNLTAEDREWFRQPVEVTVPPDNRKWLDSLMEMKQKELYDFAVFRYQVPEAAAKVSSRNDLIQLIVMANAAGGGGSIIRQKFRYINKLKGIVPPHTGKVRGGRYLYLTRGSDNNIQVFNKKTKKWVPLNELLSDQDGPAVGTSVDPQLPKGENGKVAGSEGSQSTTGDDSGAGMSDTTSMVNDAIQQTLRLVLPAVEKMTRKQLEEVVKGLGVEDTSEQRFPANRDLIEYIRNAAGEGDNPPTTE